MFLILKVVLIILLNETYAYITQDSEIILLPTWNSTDAKDIPLTLKAFGKQIQLNLRRNDFIVSSAFKAWKHNAKSITEDLSHLNTSDSCYYHHDDHISTAAINFCKKHGLEGVVFLEDITLNITPLRNNLTSSSLIGDSDVETETNVSFGKPHLIKRSVRYPADSDLFYLNNNKSRQRRSQNNTRKSLTIELAVFLDETAYRSFSSLLENDTKIRDMLLAYVNGLQALFYHPSLGRKIRILLKYMEIMQEQPTDLPNDDGLAHKVLDSFCQYANRTWIQSDLKHKWDIALYLTGLNLKIITENRWHVMHPDFSVTGSSTLESICISQSSCAIVEFGTNLHYQTGFKPTTGFASIYKAAYQIGRLLGMTDDKTMDECSNSDYIMTNKWWYDSRGTTWSTCSRRIVEELHSTKDCLTSEHSVWNNLYNFSLINLTGRTTSIYHNVHYEFHHDNSIKKEWTAKRQCELYMRDKNANVVTMKDVCQFLECEAPNQINIMYSGTYLDTQYHISRYNFFAGPALEGTHCAPGKECYNQKCDPLLYTPQNTNRSEEGNWSEWKEEGYCKSSCMEKSKGVEIKRRTCQDENGRTANCEGSSYEIKLCNSVLCNKLIPIDVFINETCRQSYAKNLVGDGVQMDYDFTEPEIPCTVFCREKHVGSVLKLHSTYYNPRIELITMGNDPYFPDGTWCHAQTGKNYYCLKHQCLPEN